jgi:2-polyprenyl-3-methyl-5-hydroxy-6-metoxy-1,4-benzoquinol methylase
MVSSKIIHILNKVKRKFQNKKKYEIKFKNLISLISSLNGSSVLLNSNQIYDSEILCEICNIRKHHDRTKTWDLLGFVSTVLRYAPNKSLKIMDAGSGSKAVLADRLCDIGYTNVYACDTKPNLEKIKNRSKIKYFSCNLEDIPVEDNEFDIIVSMSVIEHLDNPVDSLLKLAKKLCNGGILVISTDYWPDKIDCSGIYPYGENNPEMRIFSLEEIYEIVDKLNANGIRLLEDFPKHSDEKVCNWERVNRKYTFLRLAFKKYE